VSCSSNKPEERTAKLPASPQESAGGLCPLSANAAPQPPALLVNFRHRSTPRQKGLLGKGNFRATPSRLEPKRLCGLVRWRVASCRKAAKHPYRNSL
jgi:hypothetical protein